MPTVLKGKMLIRLVDLTIVWSQSNEGLKVGSPPAGQRNLCSCCLRRLNYLRTGSVYVRLFPVSHISPHHQCVPKSVPFPQFISNGYPLKPLPCISFYTLLHGKYVFLRNCDNNYPSSYQIWVFSNKLYC